MTLEWLLCVKWFDLFHTDSQYCVSNVSHMKNNKGNNSCICYLTVVEVQYHKLLLVKSSWGHSAALSDSYFILGLMKVTFSKTFNLELCKICKWIFAYANCAPAHTEVCIVSMSYFSSPLEKITACVTCILNIYTQRTLQPILECYS